MVTKRRDYRDVEFHLEFMIAKGSNSGVILHGNYEIQIRDTYGVKKPAASDCGGIYPQAKAEPTYHHIGGGSAPRINAAKPAGHYGIVCVCLGREIQNRAFGYRERLGRDHFKEVINPGINGFSPYLLHALIH